jgi:hypothetical protein
MSLIDARMVYDTDGTNISNKIDLLNQSVGQKADKSTTYTKTEIDDAARDHKGTWQGKSPSSFLSSTTDFSNYLKNKTVSYTTLVLLNGFGSTGLSTGNPAYHKSDSGIVYIKGSCTIPPTPQNKNMFQLPTGSRPSTTLTFELNGGVLVSILADGNVRFDSTTTGNVQFGCISFPAEQ